MRIYVLNLRGERDNETRIYGREDPYKDILGTFMPNVGDRYVLEPRSFLNGVMNSGNFLVLRLGDDDQEEDTILREIIG